MNINRINAAQAASSVRSTATVKRNADAQRPAAPRDEMNVSAARELGGANASNSISDVRFDLVNRIRAEIEAGTYYSDEKFQIAIDRMFDSFE